MERGRVGLKREESKLEWSKTKTIFIFIFAILNVFLYSVYINQHNQAQNVEVLGSLSIVESLKLDNITYEEFPEEERSSSYVSAKVKHFTVEEVATLENQNTSIIDNVSLRSYMKDLPKLTKDADGHYMVEDFLKRYVWSGEQYKVWEWNEETRVLTLYQTVADEPIYYSPHGKLELHLNESDEVVRYDQTALEQFVSFNQKKNILTPFEAISSLATKGYLKQNSHIESVVLGYSTLVQFTETQVFAPTWHVRVLLDDGEVEHHFINAIEGKVIDFQMDEGRVYEEGSE